MQLVQPVQQFASVIERSGPNGILFPHNSLVTKTVVRTAGSDLRFDYQAAEFLRRYSYPTANLTEVPPLLVERFRDRFLFNNGKPRTVGMSFQGETVLSAALADLDQHFCLQAQQPVPALRISLLTTLPDLGGNSGWDLIQSIAQIATLQNCAAIYTESFADAPVAWSERGFQMGTTEEGRTVMWKLAVRPSNGLR